MTAIHSDDCQTNDPNYLFPMTIESLRFPLDSSMRIIFTGYYNGFSVEVRSPEEMGMLHHMGCFGKGSLSRSKPRMAQNDSGPCIMRKRQFQKRNDWFKKFNDVMETPDTDTFFKEIEILSADIKRESERHKKKDVIDLVSSDTDHSDEVQHHECHDHPVLLDSYDKQDLAVVVPNSDSESEDYFENFKPECCLNKLKINEKLMLTLQEAFFLSYGLGCLQIMDSEDKILSTDQLWDLFMITDKKFVYKYVVYHYFRSKGFVVKPGIKFGGDFLLYKEVPALAHADYIVVVKDDKQTLDWISLLSHIRMATTTVKEVMIVEVTKLSQEVADKPENLNNYSVREIVFNRKNQFTINDDDYVSFYIFTL